ncbi:MAG: hypothetical protein QNK18_14120 [Gammaproteobacteria bacterium]|nr:hypothetical protein [Gammaproteobacteria bacterium]
MKLNALQNELEQIYDVTTPHRVEDFLLREPRLVAHLTSGTSAHECPEKLLVAQTEDGLDVGLFLHDTVLSRLAHDNPAESLHDGNLQDYCFAVEGVSHFLYLAWNASFERCITQFELELVAEVDKFVTTAARLIEQHGALEPRPLLRALFERVAFRPELREAERQRYHEANRLASRYCQRLVRQHGLNRGDATLMRELRRFYRMPQNEKIRRIEAGMPCAG